jgi:hypothetical protein
MRKVKRIVKYVESTADYVTGFKKAPGHGT